MKQLMNLLFLSCFKATALIEKRFHFKLTPVEKVQLEVHKRLCDVCMLYDKQSSGIEYFLAQSHQIENLNINIEDLQNQILKQIEIKE